MYGDYLVFILKKKNTIHLLRLLCSVAKNVFFNNDATISGNFVNATKPISSVAR